jgi:hypothetical protein
VQQLLFIPQIEGIRIEGANTGVVSSAAAVGQKRLFAKGCFQSVERSYESELECGRMGPVPIRSVSRRSRSPARIVQLDA